MTTRGHGDGGPPKLTPHENPGLAGKPPARKNLTPAPLDVCRSRKFITEAQHQAGRCHYQLFRRAGLDPNITIDWRDFLARAATSNKQYWTPDQTEARELFQRAHMTLGGGLNGPVYDLCCNEMSLAGIERKYRWSRSAAKSILRIGLDRLYEIYRGVPPPGDGGV